MRSYFLIGLKVAVRLCFFPHIVIHGHLAPLSVLAAPLLSLLHNPIQLLRIIRHLTHHRAICTLRDTSRSYGTKKEELGLLRRW